MKFPWHEAAARIQPVVFRRFLRTRGWIEADGPLNRSYVLEHRHDSGNVEVEIPCSSDFPDYQRRVVEAVEIMALFFEMPPDGLVRSLLIPSADVLSFRFMGDSFADGTLNLDEAIKLRKARRTLMLATAHSVVAAIPHHPRLARTEPLEFVDRCREAPAAVGSVVSDVIVPVSPAVGANDDLDAPFARRVTQLLANALHVASSSLEHGGEDDLLNAYASGLSSNFLAALADLAPPGGSGTLDISFRWSAVRPPPSVPSSHIAFDANVFEPLNEVARVLKERSEVPGYEVEGYIAKCSRESESPDEPGTITLVADVEDRPGLSKITMTLPADIYNRAVEAHRNGEFVRAHGKLVRLGRSLTLVDLDGFVFLDQEHG